MPVRSAASLMHRYTAALLLALSVCAVACSSSANKQNTSPVSAPSIAPATSASATAASASASATSPSASASASSASTRTSGQLPAASSAAGAPSASAAPSGVPAGWKVSQTSTFQIALPPGWQAVPIDKAQLQSFAKQVEATNPQLSKILDQLQQPGQLDQFSFYALDTNASQGSASNVNVLVKDLGTRVTSQQVATQAAPLIAKQVSGAKVTGTKSGLKIGGLDAAELQFDYPLNLPSGDSITVHVVQFHILSGTSDYIVTVTVTPPGDESTALAEQIGTSFKLK